jgi:hypothetical protein
MFELRQQLGHCICEIHDEPAPVGPGLNLAVSQFCGPRRPIGAHHLGALLVNTDPVMSRQCKLLVFAALVALDLKVE